MFRCLPQEASEGEKAGRGLLCQPPDAVSAAVSFQAWALAERGGPGRSTCGQALLIQQGDDAHEAGASRSRWAFLV